MFTERGMDEGGKENFNSLREGSHVMSFGTCPALLDKEFSASRMKAPAGCLWTGQTTT